MGALSGQQIDIYGCSCISSPLWRYVGIAPRILSAQGGVTGQLHTPATLPRCYLLYKWLGGPQNRIGRGGEKINLCPWYKYMAFLLFVKRICYCDTYISFIPHVILIYFV
jgi:hypothetical protein